MREKMTPKEFVDKCEWEGGGIGAGFEYGIDHGALDDSDPEFKELVKMASIAHSAYVKEVHKLRDKYNYYSELENE